MFKPTVRCLHRRIICSNQSKFARRLYKIGQAVGVIRVQVSRVFGGDKIVNRDPTKKETIPFIRISLLEKLHPFYYDWLRSLT